MGSRLAVLSFLLILRLIWGGLASQVCGNGQHVRLQGKIDYIEQTSTNTIVHVQHLAAKLPLRIPVQTGSEVTLVGICRRSLITFLLGRTELESAQIEATRPGRVQETLGAVTARWFIRTGQRLAEIFTRQLPDPQAGLVAGVVLGVKSQLETQFYQALINTGTIHLVVASGFNLNLIAAFLAAWSWWLLPKRTATLVTILLLAGYTLLTGAQPPTVRALLMVSIVLLLPVFGRRLPVWYVFYLALWLVLFLDPAMLASVSFQLSAAATAGLVFLQGPIQRAMSRWVSLPILGALYADLTSTLAAQVATLPIIWFTFGRISLISPLVNVLVGPLVAPLTLIGFLQLGESFLLPYGGIVSATSMALSTLMVKLISVWG